MNSPRNTYSVTSAKERAVSGCWQGGALATYVRTRWESRAGRSVRRRRWLCWRTPARWRTSRTTASWRCAGSRSAAASRRARSLGSCRAFSLWTWGSLLRHRTGKKSSRKGARKKKSRRGDVSGMFRDSWTRNSLLNSLLRFSSDNCRCGLRL